jgi:hypothetical protein
MFNISSLSKLRGVLLDDIYYLLLTIDLFDRYNYKSLSFFTKSNKWDVKNFRKYALYYR